MFIWLLILVAMASGCLLSFVYEPESSLGPRISGGTCTGLALLGLVGFVYASFLGLSNLTVALTATTLSGSFLLLISPRFRSRVAREFENSGRSLQEAIIQRPVFLFGRVALLIFGGCVVARFARGAAFSRAGAIYTNALNNLGDLPLHVSMISSFLYGQNFPPEHTQFAGARLTYPFIADFLTALFMRTGTNLTEAIFVQTLVLLLALIAVIYFWARDLTRDRVAAAFSLLLLLLSGGLGWWLFFDDVRNNDGSPAQALMHLSHEYTTEAAHGFRWGNLLETILVPQRSSLLGLPLVILILRLWWQALNGKTRAADGDGALAPSFLSSRARRMLGAGFIAGLLPLVHTTSFIVMMAMAGCLTLFFWQWRVWAAFFAAALVPALLQVWWFGHGSSVHAGNMFAWQFGWDRGSQNPFWFWFKNTGLFIPLLLLAMAWRGRDPIVPRRLLLFYAPFLLCFVIPNVARLMPWIWDNIKALIIWYIASVPLVALLLARLWRRGRAWGRSTAIVLLASMTFAGFLDVWRVMTRSSEWAVFDREALACAETIKNQTPPRALVLHAPINNHAVFLTGRRSLLGLTFMAWVHGLNYGSREGDIQRIYTGAPDAEALLKRYGVNYAVVGPTERNRFKVNESFFSKYPKVGAPDSCQLYKIAGD